MRAISRFKFVVAFAIILVVALPVMAGTMTASGTTDAGDPTLPDSLSYKHYEPVPFCVSESGTYTLNTEYANYDIYFYLYEDVVATANEIERDDDDGPGLWSLIVRNLTANQPYILAVSGFGSGQGNYEVSITGPGDVASNCGFATDDSDTGTFYFADRLNGYEIAAPVAVYPVQYGEGTGLHFYAIDSTGKGELALEVTPAMIAAVPEMPAENTLIASTPDGSITFYRLTTGEYQMNAGSYVIVFSELYTSAAYYMP